MLLKMTDEVRIQGGAAGGGGDSPDDFQIRENISCFFHVFHYKFHLSRFDSLRYIQQICGSFFFHLGFIIFFGGEFF